MQGTDDLITQEEAISFTGLSASTLTRFAEAGYLKVEGSRFHRAELATLFGGSAKTASSPVPTFSGTSGYSAFARESTVTTTALTDVATPEERTLTVEDAPAPQPGAASLQERIEVETIPPRADASEDDVPADSGDESASEESSEQFTEGWRRMILLQEKVIEMRETEIAELKRERDWLKIRVERLEQKAERDQLLLLSETQVIRKLMTHSLEQPRSVVQMALEWLGIKTQKAEPNGSVSSGMAPVASTSIDMTENSTDGRHP